MGHCPATSPWGVCSPGVRPDDTNCPKWHARIDGLFVFGYA
jgi:hypothetical protein